MVWTINGPVFAAACADLSVDAEGHVLLATADFTGDGEAGEGWIVCENRGDIFVAQ